MRKNPRNGLRGFRAIVLERDPRITLPLLMEFPSARRREGGELSSYGGPMIRLTEPIYLETRNPSSKTQLFTWTGKMRCPSLSLPAGPPSILGVCAMAEERVVRAIEARDPEGFRSMHDPLVGRPDENRYICDVCYATKGRYHRFRGLIAKQRIVKEWIDLCLEKGGEPVAWPWHRSKREVARNLDLFVPDTLVRLMGEAVGFLASDSVASVMRWKGVDTRYFRLFDSGECYSPVLYLGLREIAKKASHVRFWMPTRAWVFERFREVVNIFPPPPNLVLRPSALFLNALPPRVPGMAAGTMVMTDGRGADMLQAVEGIWKCPAYFGGKTESCTENHSGPCRVCWDRPDLPVSYMYH